MSSFLAIFGIFQFLHLKKNRKEFLNKEKVKRKPQVNISTQPKYHCPKGLSLEAPKKIFLMTKKKFMNNLMDSQKKLNFLVNIHDGQQVIFIQ